MVSSARKCVISSALVALAAGLVACGRGDPFRPAQTTTTGAMIPRPDALGVTSRTIDNAGFVDNGGRTSDETARTALSGMRATELGSERLTGTPGSGAPIPLPASALPRSVEEVLLEGARTPASSTRERTGLAQDGPSIESIGRLARARCDRETACNRVGEGQLWSTQESCVTQQRERVRDDLASLSCERGFDGVQLRACLNAVRLQACTDARSALDAVSECRSSALCNP
jgi:hypothetical protein